MNFGVFKSAVAARFANMAKTGLFRVDVSRDEIWETYLASFPAGSNPIYRERTEHDCNCCKQFIRTVGNVVSIQDGRLVSIWDIDIGSKEPEYQAVADGMSALIHSRKIVNVFRHYEAKAGTNQNYESLDNGKVQSWDHFFVNIPREYVLDKHRIDTVLGEYRSTYDVLARGLNELSMDSMDTVLELIAQNSLYRGEEHRFLVSSFRNLKVGFSRLETDSLRQNYIWNLVIGSTSPAVLRARNSVIGTLLVDLSGDVDLETAVRTFESKVAPTNYRRPKALVTKDMIRRAKEAVAGLGLTSALERRYAVMSDITVNNILFADRNTRKILAGDVFDDLMESSAKGKPKALDKVEEVSIDRFLADILPTATSLEVLMENRHANNLVSLIAPTDPTAGRLFKWNNGFSWTYAGDVADSIRERVKRAGGNVTGEFCNRLAWYNYDDLDFHMAEPGGGHIYFGTRGRRSACGGDLDVDMNAGGGTTREPVENIVYDKISKMRPGRYRLSVHNFNKRETRDEGFEVEVDILGTTYHFGYPRAVASGETVQVAEFEYSVQDGLRIVDSLPGSTAQRELWNVTTNKFHPVNVVMLSPNHWDGQGVGNRHYFFMLEGCRNAETARGFYNEFLDAELNQHRKVLEIVGSKVRTDESDEQLSGLGFSSTQRNELMVRVGGKFTRVVKVVF
jgi:hypothetical protein